MKRILLIAVAVCSITVLGIAQSIEELKSAQAEKSANADELQAQVDALKVEVDDLQIQIDKLAGWRKGVNGIVGFDFNKSSGWIANPNPDASSSSLNISVNAFMLMDKDKTFWHNKGLLTKSWQDVDLAEKDEAGLFENGTVDILNLSSLAGYKIAETFALSGQAEINTSLGNMFNPGTFDIGLGATWLPTQNMTVVIHPFNYRYAFAAGEVMSSGAVGAKLRIDYTREFDISGKALSWSSTLTSYIPYSDTKQTITLADGSTYESNLNEYTWLNTFAFEVWKGIGVGVTFGYRNAKFESRDNQRFTSIGLSYGF